MAELEPRRLAVVAGSAALTFRELCDRADLIGRGLRSAAVPDGAVIATNIPPGPDFFALALAALKGGFGLFGVPMDLSGTVSARLVRDARTVLAVTSGGAPFTELSALTVEELGSAAGLSPAPRHAPRAGFLVFATSGTTGGPVVVARARPPYSYRGVAVVPEHGAGPDRGPHLMASPSYHLGTIGPALYALQAGSAVIVQRRWSPRLFCTLADEHRAESAFVNPHQLTSLVTHGAVPAHSFSALFHGGSPVAPDIKYEAIDLFGDAIREFYGTSQGIISEVSAPEWLCRPGTVGRPLPGVRVAISREATDVPAGVPGDIRVRYRPVDADAQPCAYQNTGDLGYMDDSGYIFIVGRKGRAQQDGPALLEHMVRRLPGISDVAVVPVPYRPGHDQVICYIEQHAGAPQAISGHVENLASRLGIDVARIVVAAAGHLPRTPSGKLWRARLAPAPEHGDPVAPSAEAAHHQSSQTGPEGAP